jgi:hypothetical protein
MTLLSPWPRQDTAAPAVASKILRPSLVLWTQLDLCLEKHRQNLQLIVALSTDNDREWFMNVAIEEIDCLL